MINGLALREAREAKGLTQEELGKMVGLTQQAIWKMEQGGQRATVAIYKIALILGKPASYFDPTIPKGGIDDRILELPEDDQGKAQAAVIAVIDAMNRGKPF
jgi:transcriptional regulator with XRE-family HTH domain